MSIPFNQDTSTQLTYSSFPYTITNVDGFATSNYANTLSLNNSNYTAAASNLLKSLIDTTNTNLSTNYYNKLSTDTLLNTKEAILSFTAPLTRSTNTIGINLGSYSTTGNDANYLLKTGGTMSGALTNNSTTASGFRYLTITHIDTRLSHLPFNDNKFYLRGNVIIDGPTDTLSLGSKVQDNILLLYGTDYGLGINSGTLRYNVPTTAVHKFYTGTTNTATIGATGTITATAFSGDGANITNVAYANITGKPTYFAIDPALYYTQTQINTNISTAQTNNSNYSFNISNVLNINSSNYASNVSNVIIINSSNYASNISNVLNRNNSNYASNISNVIIINSSNYASNISNVLNINSSNYASNISNVLNRNNSNYASNISNVLNINSSNYASNVSNVIITNTNATYLKLAGGTLTGDLTGTTIRAPKINCSDATGVDATTLARNLNIVGVNAVIRIWRSNTTGNPSMEWMAGPTTSVASYVWFWDMYIGTATEANYFAIRDRRTGGGSPIRLLIDTNGNIGISTTTPSSKLTINNIVNDRGTFDHSGSPLTITHQTATSTAQLNDPLPILHLCRQGTGSQSYGARATFNLCRFENSSTNSRSRLDISLANGGYDDVNIMSIKSDGKVGIGTTNPLSRFTIRMDYGDGNTGGLCIDSADFSSTYSLRVFSYVQAGGQVGYIFQVINIAPGVSINSTVNAITLNYDGGVNIGNYLRIQGRSIYNNLFNSSGNDHGTLTDFNGITDFGYRFINSPATNGPGTPTNPANQYYSWMIGLGSGYNYDSFGAQFCIPRNTANPVLSIRYRDNSGVWGGWSGITASVATSLIGSATINANEWLRSSDSSRQRIFFGDSSTTYYQGYGQYTADVNHEWRNHQGTAVMKLLQPGSLYLTGTIVPTLLSVSSTNTDYCGIQIDTVLGSTYQYPLMVLRGTFTGFHRCFIDNEELFDINDIQKFKDDYVGRIVISTGKIATEMSDKDCNWEIKYDKNGITIEDAVPMIQLSRTKKDKRVFGVLGDPKRSNTREERMIVNSVGEGGIMVINSNGNIENGDYIQSSGILGYGEKQDDDLLHNYTVAKATMDCSFELDSPLYQCFEIENNLRVAFISATYHCG